MPLNTKTTVEVELLCDAVACGATAKLPEDKVSSSPWLIFRKGDTKNLFLYERLESITAKRMLSTSVRMPSEKRAIFCSKACAERTMKAELDEFLHTPRRDVGERSQLTVTYYHE